MFAAMQPKPAAVRLDGAALKVLREKDGHTLTTFAAVTGYSLSYINDLEKGRRKGNAAVVKALATALNVPTSMLEARRDAA